MSPKRECLPLSPTFYHFLPLLDTFLNAIFLQNSEFCGVLEDYRVFNNLRCSLYLNGES